MTLVERSKRREAQASRTETSRGQGFVVASVRITLIDRDVPSYFQSLEHLLRYCARPPFALERLSVIRGEDGRISRVRYVLPRHKAASWVGSGRGRKSTRPGASAVGGHAAGGDTTGDCCDLRGKTAISRHLPTPKAKLMARVGEEFPFACPGCGGDIRLIAFITDPGPIRKILAHLGEPLEPPPPRSAVACRSAIGRPILLWHAL